VRRAHLTRPDVHRLTAAGFRRLRPALPVAATLTAFLGVASPVRPQPADRELAALRKHLALPESVSLAPAASSELPPAQPLRVRLAFGLDLKARQNVARWIEEWNRKETGRHRAMVVVAVDADADLVLARYANRERVRSQTVTGPDLVPSGPAGTRSGTRSRFTIDTVPVYGYVIDSRRRDAWTILWRHTGFTTLEETGGSGRELWDGLRELLKKRHPKS